MSKLIREVMSSLAVMPINFAKGNPKRKNFMINRAEFTDFRKI